MSIFNFPTWGEFARFWLSVLLAIGTLGVMIYYAPDMLDKMILVVTKIYHIFK